MLQGYDAAVFDVTSVSAGSPPHLDRTFVILVRLASKRYRKSAHSGGAVSAVQHNRYYRQYRQELHQRASRDRHATEIRHAQEPGNLNNEIGLPLTLLQLESSHERAILEMGMYALGEIRELCRIALPTIGIVTNIGRAS